MCIYDDDDDDDDDDDVDDVDNDDDLGPREIDGNGGILGK